MKAVILAAGKGTRLRPLTLDKPKPLVEVAGKTLLERTFNALPKEVDEVILVVGYLADKIKDFCGNNFCGRKVSYVFQKEQLGTGHALQLCAPHLQEEKFFVINSDDLLGKEGLRRCLKHDFCLLVDEHKEASRFGVISLREDGSIEEILEKPDNPLTNLVSTGVFVLDKRIFNYDYRAVKTLGGEYYLPRMVNKMAADHKIFTEKADFWFPIASSDDIIKAECLIKNNLS